jgi:5'-nucleotidase
MKHMTLLMALACATLMASGPLAAQNETWPHTVLLTNDDGIDAEGLRALVRAFAPVAKVYVIAPMGNRSGSTNYVSAIATRELEVEPRDLGDGVTAYAVDGYPADAVVFGLGGLLLEDPPDLVISGVNTGPNLSSDWTLSGTVGAARMAAFYDIPAIAVSGWSAENLETLEATARWTVELSRTHLVRYLEPGQYLTVSIPRVPLSEIEGVELARRGPRPYNLVLVKSGEPASTPQRELWNLSFRPHPAGEDPGTDTHAYDTNHVVIVPMRVGEVDFDVLGKLLESDPGIPAWPPSGSQE